MELSWLMKLRIAAALAVGVILIGILAWPLAKPPDPFAVVLATDISFGGAITLAALAFWAGFIAYFLSWPHGREIGILAVPAGLAIWAARTGNMASLMQQNPTFDQRQAIFAMLKWEPIFWLAIVAAGFAGVILGQKIHSKPKSNKTEKKPNPKSNMYLNAALALIGSVLIAQICIGFLARDFRIFDGRLGSVVAQPAAGQIVFAVLVSFGIAAFMVKKFLNVSYICPIVAAASITAFAISFYIRQNTLQHLCQRWPAIFFPNAVTSILPVQMVAFGTLGSIIGYWLAVRYNYWRKHETK